MHYLRLEPHRHATYLIHLIFVFALIIYLPYSKLAHVIYRTTALVYAEHTGRGLGTAHTGRGFAATPAKPAKPAKPEPSVPADVEA